MNEPAQRQAPVPQNPLQPVDLAVAEAVGALMELWGFRRQLGRVWAVLFLSDKPLAAPELCARLENAQACDLQVAVTGISLRDQMLEVLVAEYLPPLPHVRLSGLLRDLFD